MRIRWLTYAAGGAANRMSLETRARAAAEARVLKRRIERGDDYAAAKARLAELDTDPHPEQPMWRAARAMVEFTVAVFSPPLDRVASIPHRAVDTRRAARTIIGGDTP